MKIIDFNLAKLSAPEVASEVVGNTDNNLLSGQLTYICYGKEICPKTMK